MNSENDFDNTRPRSSHPVASSHPSTYSKATTEDQVGRTGSKIFEKQTRLGRTLCLNFLNWLKLKKEPFLRQFCYLCLLPKQDKIVHRSIALPMLLDQSLYFPLASLPLTLGDPKFRERPEKEKSDKDWAEEEGESEIRGRRRRRRTEKTSWAFLKSRVLLIQQGGSDGEINIAGEGWG